MVLPIASNGQHSSWLTLLAAVTAATYVEPSPLTAVWIRIEPIAVMEY